jgi:hypothetical protein
MLFDLEPHTAETGLYGSPGVLPHVLGISILAELCQDRSAIAGCHAMVPKLEVQVSNIGIPEQQGLRGRGMQERP